MGNFDAYAIPKRDTRPSRSVLRKEIGPRASNTTEDIYIITRILISAGLLDEAADPALTHSVIFRAIRHARQTLTLPPASPVGADHISPGDETERAVRRALARGRLPLAHRAIAESTSPKGARGVIDNGMRRALARLNSDKPAEDIGSACRRALLPAISPETFQSNRRLAEALIAGGHIDNLEFIIAQAIAEGAKQGYSNIRDFFQVLKSRSPDMALELFEKTAPNLSGMALHRFRKLYHAIPPIEGDFKPDGKENTGFS